MGPEGAGAEADAELIAAENRRLRLENRQLRESVSALELSHWWRAHPRFLVRRLRERFGRASTAVEKPEPMADLEEQAIENPIAARFRGEVIERGSFQLDTVTGAIASWEPILAKLDDRSVRVLEIGSFEGLSACYFLWRLPRASLTCIDTFSGGAEDVAYDSAAPDLEATFDRNVALVDASRVRKMRGGSSTMLLELTRAGQEFDLVYVDASHLGLDVLVDAALSWRLLRPQGVCIFDDYTWSSLGVDPLLRPGPAIDAFLGIVDRHGEVILRGSQVAIRKTADGGLS